MICVFIAQIVRNNFFNHMAMGPRVQLTKGFIFHTLALKSPGEIGGLTILVGLKIDNLVLNDGANSSTSKMKGLFCIHVR